MPKWARRCSIPHSRAGIFNFTWYLQHIETDSYASLGIWNALEPESCILHWHLDFLNQPTRIDVKHEDKEMHLDHHEGQQPAPTGEKR